MNSNNCPDAWDQGGDSDMTTLTAAAGALNVEATPFVPGKNVFATEFVPFGVGTAAPAAPPAVAVPPETASVATAPVVVNDKPSDQNCTIPNLLIPDGVESKMESDNCENISTSDQPTLHNNDPVPGHEKMDSAETPEDWSDKTSETSSTRDEGGGTGSSSATGGASRPKKQPKLAHVATKRSDHLNIVFIGHVDAGKSTIGGHIMFLTGMVDKRTLEKYEREAKEKNRESWYLSWALDTNIEERDKGKTVEVGRAYFETENKHFTILDAPGHKSFVPNMIGGASQADVAVLVISARKGEFETGFERGGQTREHAMLVKTAGVRHLIVVVNKMDDPTVEWDEGRYNEIKDKLTPYLRKCGFNPKTDIFYIPVSGLTGYNLKETQPNICSWYDGPSLIGYLDNLPTVSRMNEGPVRLPIVDRYKDMGTIVLGKVESGVISKNQSLIMMPNRLTVEVMQLFSDDEETDQVHPGENVKIKLKNIEEEDVSPGFILCSPDSLCHTAKVFDAQVVVLEHKSIICAGYSAVMHLHTSAEEVVIKALLCLVDKKTNEKSTTRPRFIKQDQIAIVRLEVLGGMICLEPFKDFPQMGRFTLRDEGKTIGIGKVLKVIA
jgi:peptide chain release factor subunit 3